MMRGKVGSQKKLVRLAWFIGSLGVLTYGVASATNLSKPDFATDVDPILRAHCSPCHYGKEPAGGLSFDQLAGLMKGGVSGSAIQTRNSGKSRLIRRILGQDGLPRMPIGFNALADADIATLRSWIDQGAKASSTTARRTHWAYVVPVRPPIPAFKQSNWVRNPIDSFVLSTLTKNGLKPSPEADRATLIRRVTLDLIGLPPTTFEVDDFMADRSPGAYERVVDRLLASKHYGERMALPWLDLARYADSNGFQQEGDNQQYGWRDWVVRAINQNMPFDEFTVEQLAGDLLPNATADQIVATGFNRNHMLNGEGGAIPEEQRSVNLFDRVDTTSTAWLGLTMACARCHDHKYDPISQRDYYRMMAHFNQVPETGVPSGGGQYRIADPTVYGGTKDQIKRLSTAENELAKLKTANPHDKKQIAAASEIVEKIRAEMPRVMVMSDAQPRKTFIFNRGNYLEHAEEVEPGLPEKIARTTAPAKNRLALARWIVSSENPLTARFFVNRTWQLFFGRGLVRTEENFGVKGEPPTHPELLDWLAIEFRERGWDVKRLQRLIVTSSAYRQSSRVTPDLIRRDPENRLLARGTRFRLPSSILRDIALKSSGLLNPAMGGKPVYPYQPKEIWDGLAITLERDFKYPQSKGSENYRRSIYTFWRRTAAPGNMFDASSRQVCTVRNSVTSSPLHALTMLNDVTWVEAGRGLAQEVLKLPARSRLSEAFRRVCTRRPNASELKVLERSLARSQRYFESNSAEVAPFLATGDLPVNPKLNPVEVAAYASVCLAIYNLDEAMTRE